MMGLFLLSQAACLGRNTIRSLRLSNFAETAWSYQAKEHIGLTWLYSQMLTWSNQPGSLSLGQNSCSLKYCWMMSGLHAKQNIPEESNWIENKEEKSFHSAYARCTGEGCLLDYRVSNVSRTQCWKRGESEYVKGLWRSRGMLLLLQKPCWPARLAVYTREGESCCKRMAKWAVEVEAPVGSRGRQS